MKTVFLTLSEKRPSSYVLESRVIFWNLLLTMLASSVLLLLYLRQILNF